MAIEQHTRTQVACKLINFCRLGPRSASFFERPEQPAAAEKVDGRVQQRKIKGWVDQKKREIGVEKKLKQYFREVEILASISHVSQAPSWDQHSHHASAEHNQY